MQSFLELHKRPVVQFDPRNPHHREQMAVFLRTGTWAKSPYAFYAPDNLSIRAYAMQTMVEYYIAEEFPRAETAKPARRKKIANSDTKSGKLIAIRSGTK